MDLWKLLPPGTSRFAHLAKPNPSPAAPVKQKIARARPSKPEVEEPRYMTGQQRAALARQEREREYEARTASLAEPSEELLADPDYAEGRLEVRERARAILKHPAAANNMALAVSLATKTSLSAEKAIKLLGKQGQPRGTAEPDAATGWDRAFALIGLPRKR